MTITLLLIIWFVVGAICAPLSYGLYFAYFQGKWPELAEHEYQRDRQAAFIHALLTLVCWPTVFVHLIHGGTRYGLKFR